MRAPIQHFPHHICIKYFILVQRSYNIVLSLLVNQIRFNLNRKKNIIRLDFQ